MEKLQKIWEWLKKQNAEANKQAELIKRKKQARVDAAKIQVGDQVLLIRTKGRVKKGNKGVCTFVHPTGGTLVFEILFDIGFLTGNMSNPVKLRFTEFEREAYLVKINN